MGSFLACGIWIRGLLADSLRRQRQASQPGSGGGKDRFADRRRQPDDRRLSRACGGQAFPIENHDLDVGHVGQARHPVLRKAGVDDAAALGRNYPFSFPPAIHTTAGAAVAPFVVP